VIPADDRRPPITPQLAVRVAVLGVLALTLFAIVFFRLWFLQVLSGDEYLVQARENRTRDLRIAAPRGEIVDRNGRVLVDSRTATVVQLEPDELPEAERDAAARWGQAMTRRSRRPRGRRGPPVPIPPVATPMLERRFRSLARLLDMRTRTIQERTIQQLAVLPYSNVTIRTDVSRSILNFIRERKEAFRGVETERVFLRRYPRRNLAAQLVGYVGEITEDELRQRRNRGVVQGTVIGKAGVEYTYDRYLRGRDGARILRVDANGDFAGELRRRREPVPGRNLQLSLDLDLQRSSQEALAAVGGGLPGAFVAMDPTNGQVLALGSYPTFDPTVFTRPITQARYEQLSSEATGAPLFNRATGGFYATGSTFKPVTALAGLTSGVIDEGTVINDPGFINIGPQRFQNAGATPYGAVALRRALQVSSDVYFYLIGRDTNTIRDQPLQRWARRLGFGRRTGIDLPAEGRGLVPDREWRARQATRERRCRRRERISLQADVFAAAAQGCGISDMRPWSVGDNVNLSVGQGDIQASPLQMAVAYSAIYTGGRVPRPHLGLEIQDGAGRTVQEIDAPPVRRVRMDPGHRQAIEDGLAAAVRAPGGTSTSVFAGWPHSRFPVFGKTGTAETSRGDQSWYVAYVRHRGRPIVVAVTVERGGFGAERAAPIACRMLRSWYRTRVACSAGASRTR